jgi:hypothetical protein
MGLAELTSIHSVTHQRGISVRGPAGGAIRQWQIIQPNPKLCRIMTSGMDTDAPFDREAVEYTNVAYWHYDPQTIEQDQLLWINKSAALLGGMCESATNGGGSYLTPGVTLASTASSVDNFYTGNLIEMAGQQNFIAAYNGASKFAAVVQPWATVPNPGQGYVISVAKRRIFWVVGQKDFDERQRLWRCNIEEILAKV